MTIPASDYEVPLKKSTPSPRKTQRSLFTTKSPIPKSMRTEKATKARRSFSFPGKPSSPLKRQNSVDGTNRSLQSIGSVDSETSFLSYESEGDQYPLRSCLKKRPKRGIRFLPKVKLRQKRKTVTFDNYDRCKWTISLQEYSKSEFKASFVCDEELEHSLHTNEAIAEKERQRRRRNNPNEKKYMSRGIEKLINNDHVLHHRQQAYAAVLRNGVFIPDDADIELYKTISDKCLAEALLMAEKDAEFARRYQQDNKTNKKDTMKDGSSNGEFSSRELSRDKTPVRRENRKTVNMNTMPNPAGRRQRPSRQQQPCSRQPSSRAAPNNPRRKRLPPPPVRRRRTPTSQPL